MEAEARKKVEETVIKILKQSNLKEDTEFKIRIAASEELSIDLSSLESKTLVRSIVERFLVSDVEAIKGGKESDAQEEAKQDALERSANEVKREAVDDGERDLQEGSVQKEANEAIMQEEKLAMEINKEAGGGGGSIICKLAERRCVAIHDYKGKNLISIRDYYIKNGKEAPSARGISLSSEQWSVLRSSIPAIGEAIKKMETNSWVPPVVNEETMPPGSISSTTVASVTAGLVPLEIPRFDGKNYQPWANQMELFLKQLNIAYVLTQPLRHIIYSEEETTVCDKVAEQKWLNDDYLCRRNILGSLSDGLFYKYSLKKSISAKQLWEELKLVYLSDVFGGKRLQVKKYMEFEIVEEGRGSSVSEQVQELNCLADAIVGSGVALDEFFHVSVILSKLPASWKDLCLRFVHNDFLSFRVLMDVIRVEEEQRRNQWYATCGGGGGGGDVPNPKVVVAAARPEAEIGSGSRPPAVVVCFACGKMGHISRNCWNRKNDKERGTIPSSVKEPQN